ncbi:hypothetical protein BH10PLA1_BH10PLA1_15350 [soil metagenome]
MGKMPMLQNAGIIPVMADPPPLQYGTPDTQFGVIIERLADGGVKLTVPFAHGYYSLIAVLRKAFRQFPHRGIITLDRTELHIVEPTNHPGPGERDGAHHVHYPFECIGQIRKNRYSAGVYVNITGQASFDLLADCPAEIVRYVSETLEQTLAALRAQGT